ncbi:unnamed protein product, partial [Ixodes pacificus]
AALRSLRAENPNPVSPFFPRTTVLKRCKSSYDLPAPACTGAEKRSCGAMGTSGCASR